jgi:ribosomal protein S27E
MSFKNLAALAAFTLVLPVALHAQSALQYGVPYHIQNGVSSWSGGYLDTRGAGCEDNLLCVSTASTATRDGGKTGTWILKSKGGKTKGAVLCDDDVYLANQYDDSYLDTRGKGCEDNAYCVSTATGTDRASGSGTWKLIPDSCPSGTILTNMPVHLLNGFSGFNGGFLDVRGSGCEGNLFCVSTTSPWNRDNGSTVWRFVP